MDYFSNPKTPAVNGCLNPYFAHIDNGDYRYPLPCGNCEHCRWKQSRVWAFRLEQELLSWNGKALFVTLTYNDENLPERAELNPSHLQGFFKRLRYYLSEKFNISIKYYACGEYGDRFGRPHYHAIIFGIDEEYTAIIRRCWPFGFVRKPSNVRGVEAMNYVAGYVQKKIGNSDAVRRAFDNRLPMFSRMSKGLGIGFVARMPIFSPLIMRGKKYMFIGRYLVKKLAEKFGVLEQYAQESKQRFLDKWNDIYRSLGVPVISSLVFKSQFHNYLEISKRWITHYDVPWFCSQESFAYAACVTQYKRDFLARQALYQQNRSLDEKIKNEFIA